MSGFHFTKHDAHERSPQSSGGPGTVWQSLTRNSSISDCVRPCRQLAILCVSTLLNVPIMSCAYCSAVISAVLVALLVNEIACRASGATAPVQRAPSGIPRVFQRYSTRPIETCTLVPCARPTCTLEPCAHVRLAPWSLVSSNGDRPGR